MVKIMIEKKKENNCEIGVRRGGKTKATYKNSEIGEKVTWFDIWENYFLLSFSCQSHFQVSTKWESFFCFFSMLVSNYLRLNGQENFRSQRGQVPFLALLWLHPCPKGISNSNNVILQHNNLTTFALTGF